MADWVVVWGPWAVGGAVGSKCSLLSAEGDVFNNCFIDRTFGSLLVSGTFWLGRFLGNYWDIKWLLSGALTSTWLPLEAADKGLRIDLGNAPLWMFSNFILLSFWNISNFWKRELQQLLSWLMVENTRAFPWCRPWVKKGANSFVSLGDSILASPGSKFLCVPLYDEVTADIILGSDGD